jgi:hypothetical protein
MDLHTDREVVFTLTARSSDHRDGAADRLRKRIERELELLLGSDAFELVIAGEG